MEETISKAQVKALSTAPVVADSPKPYRYDNEQESPDTYQVILPKQDVEVVVDEVEDSTDDGLHRQDPEEAKSPPPNIEAMNNLPWEMFEPLWEGLEQKGQPVDREDFADNVITAEIEKEIEKRGEWNRHRTVVESNQILEDFDFENREFLITLLSEDSQDSESVLLQTFAKCDRSIWKIKSVVRSICDRANAPDEKEENFAAEGPLLATDGPTQRILCWLLKHRCADVPVLSGSPLEVRNTLEHILEYQDVCDVYQHISGVAIDLFQHTWSKNVLVSQLGPEVYHDFVDCQEQADTQHFRPEARFMQAVLLFVRVKCGEPVTLSTISLKFLEGHRTIACRLFDSHWESLCLNRNRNRKFYSELCDVVHEFLIGQPVGLVMALALTGCFDLLELMFQALHRMAIHSHPRDFNVWKTVDHMWRDVFLALPLASDQILDSWETFFDWSPFKPPGLSTVDTLAAYPFVQMRRRNVALSTLDLHVSGEFLDMSEDEDVHRRGLRLGDVGQRLRYAKVRLGNRSAFWSRGVDVWIRDHHRIV